jgi:N-acetyl-anhydromuramyl-L-alanine amidase AmpD
MGNQSGVARVAQLSGIRATGARHVFRPPRVVGMDDQNPNRKAAPGTAFPEAYEHLLSVSKLVTGRLPLPVRS